MALNKTDYQIKHVEAAAASSVPFSQGQFIIQDDGKLFYDPSTATTVAGRVELSPDLSGFIQKTVAAQLVTAVKQSGTKLIISAVQPDGTAVTDVEIPFVTKLKASYLDTDAEGKNLVTAKAARDAITAATSGLATDGKITELSGRLDTVEGELPKKLVKTDIKGGKNITVTPDETGNTVTIAAADAPEYTLKSQTVDADSPYTAIYQLMKGDVAVDGSVINIPKDQFLEGADLVKDPTGRPAGTYIKLTFKITGEKGKEDIYINVTELLDNVAVVGTPDGTNIAVTVTTDAEQGGAYKVAADLSAEAKKTLVKGIAKSATNGKVDLTMFDGTKTENIDIVTTTETLTGAADTDLPNVKAVNAGIAAATAIYRYAE